jgi:hypothetical protein
MNVPTASALFKAANAKKFWLREKLPPGGKLFDNGHQK